MGKELFLQAIGKFVLGVLLVALLLFLPAGTLHYWNGWLLMGILFGPMFAAGIMLMIKKPSLLQKRLDAKEKEGEQQTVVKLSGSMFVVGFLLCGLNYRFAWFLLPDWVVITAAIVFLMCCTGKCFAKTPICREPSRCRKIRRWLTQDCTEL